MLQAALRGLRDWGDVVRMHMDPSAPPVEGWQVPVIGAGLTYARKGPAWLFERFREHDGTFAVHLMGKPIVLSSDADFVSEFYVAPTSEVSFWEGLTIFPAFKALMPLGLSGPEHDNAGIEALKAYLPPVVLEGSHILDSELRTCLEHKALGRRVELHTLLRYVVLRITSVLLAGKRVAHDDDFLAAMLDLDDSVLEVAKTMGSQKVVERGLRHRQRALETLLREVRDRRAEAPPAAPRDFLDAMLLAKHPETGLPLSDEVIASDMVGYHFGTTANTPATTALCLLHILNDPELMRRVVAEQDEIARELGPTIDKHALRKMRLLTGCYHETLRLYAPGLHLRRAIRPMKVGRYTLPAGTVVGTSPYAVHRDDAVYEQPERFEPDRWVDGPLRPQGRMSAKHFLPFGRGVHACLGRNLARQEVLLVVARLLRDFDVVYEGALEPNKVDWATNGIAAPATETWVRLRPRGEGRRGPEA